MNICKACGHKNKADLAFCVSCGTSLEQPTVTSPTKSNEEAVKNSKFNKQIFLFLTIGIVLGVALFTSYQLLAKKYSAEAMKEQFKTALIEEDKSALQPLIHPTDKSLKVDDESLQALFALIDSEPSILQEILDDLDSRSTSGLFYIDQDGKQYGIFDRYVIATNAYYMHLYDLSAGKTTFYLNDQELATVNEAEEYREVGPYLVGSYSVKAVNSEQGEDVETVKLAGSQRKVEVYFDTEVSSLANDDFETEDWTESHNGDRDDGSYVLPGSDSIRYYEEDLYALSSNELRLARNEIFARHGFVFDDEELVEYFNNKAWYRPDPTYDGSLSAVELHNIDVIKSLE